MTATRTSKIAGSSQRRGHAYRSRKGQAIAAGSGFLVLISMLAAGLLLCLANFAILGNYNERLQGVANEIAERAANEEYRLGVEREYDPDTISAVGSGFIADRKHLDAELKLMGVQPGTVYNYHVESSDATVRDIPVKLYTVSFDVFGLPICGGVLPSVIPLHVVGSSSNYSEHVRERHGSALILFTDPDPKYANRQRGVRVPIYNATLGRNTPADPTHLHIGPMVGQPPEAYLRVQCNSVDGFVNPPG
jgi:hypothetical protein